eukprot:TRINITY_DN2918_c0_g1_i12.p2 TRINITY_DN2918_c0_g1~~TRINITY_DN2918_c0_g1_i12.p2  ORF type:complete len:195 (-),score=19.75 TRINITY_DN2918_c0_g1_i12:1599-2183(-)
MDKFLNRTPASGIQFFYSELGASLAILQAGYNIDSFMMRYQGVDWRNKDTWACNDRTNPSGQYYYDGISLHPFEVLFVKVKDHLLYNRWDFVRTAYKYDEWMVAQYADDGSLDLLGNEWKSTPGDFKIPYVLAMERRGQRCFDVEYYKENNRDLNSGWSKDRFFEHFVQFGQFEGRQFRFTCEADFSGILKEDD